MNVCLQCFGESAALRARIELAGIVGDCPTCGASSTPVMDAAQLEDLFQGLEARYGPLCGDPYTLGKEGITGIGPDTGDDSLAAILREDWEVFSNRVDDNQAAAILACVWPGYTGEYMVQPTKRWREVQGEIDDLKRRLCASGSDLSSGEAQLRAMLDPWVDSLGSHLATSSWVRARIHNSRGSPFSAAEMGPPPAEKATAGRANRRGIPFLYVASDVPTAIAEVRAEPGDWVTLVRVDVPPTGTLVLDLTRDVRVIDPFAHTDLDQASMVREFVHQFGYELSRPVRSKDAEVEYAPTQMIAEYFHANGYSGIIFLSSVSAGINAVFFEPSMAAISSPTERGVWSKALDVVDGREFDRRGRLRRGLPH